MTDCEEETYSTVFTSLRHPIRRKILRTLSAGAQNFSDLQRAFNIEFSYDLSLGCLGNLLLKTTDGKYMLSPLGRTAVSMMRQVEEPPSKTPSHVSLSLKKWKLLVVALTMGIILLSAAFYFRVSEHESAQLSVFRLGGQIRRERFGRKRPRQE